MKTKLILLYIGVMIVLSLTIGLVLKSALVEFKSNYEKPDTTITIHNGKSDTLITKKQLPKWLN